MSVNNGSVWMKYFGVIRFGVRFYYCDTGVLSWWAMMGIIDVVSNEISSSINNVIDVM